MSAPNFIYIGPDKAGSSWLHEILLTHPQVFMPEAKDLYFFDRYYDRGSAWYLDQFAAASAQQRVVGEVCQDYLFEPLAPQRIHETLGPIRMMVTLRDPADRAFSSYLYMLRQGQTPGTFLEALESRPELLDHGRYATGLARFRDVFGPDAVFIGVFDDFAADPQAYVDRLLAWLDIEPLRLSDEQREAMLPAARARSRVLARLARSSADLVREKLDGANLIGRVKRSALVQRVLYVPLGDDKPTMTDDERAAVHRALGPEIAQLDCRYGLGLARRWGWPVEPGPSGARDRVGEA